MGAVAELKAKANDAFRAGKFSLADDLYTSALDGLQTELDCNAKDRDIAAAVLLGNRANARLKLEMYAAAIEDATIALERNPAYIKAYYRRGSAAFALGKYKPARKDFAVIAKRVPTAADARRNLDMCDKRIREAAFAKAIESDSARVRVAENIDVSSFTVDDSYDGPRIGDDGVITREFVIAMMERFKSQQKLHVKYALMIMLSAKKIMDALPNIVDVPVLPGEKITVCGDVHGQYYDLANAIFSRNGLPSKENPYVFNGDFVDRGSFSVEVILTLLALKVWNPACIHLTRGNHESQNMNKIYGFEGEVRAKYTNTVFQLFSELFQSLPLAYVLDGKTTGATDGKRAFIVHGGLFSRDGVTLQELQELNRHCEPDAGLMAEMLWSDPQDTPGWGQSKRGIGVAFGPDVTHRFLDGNGLDLVVRSHEMKDEGYEVGADGRLITIFSAPNYCDQMGNKGAYILFDHTMEAKFTQFEAMPVRFISFTPSCPSGDAADVAALYSNPSCSNPFLYLFLFVFCCSIRTCGRCNTRSSGTN